MGMLPTVTTDNEKSAPAPASSEPAPTAASGSVFGVPVAAFVRGGTTSYRHDLLMKQQAAEDEDRRRVSDEEKRLVATEGARMYTQNLGTPQQHPVVKLLIVNPKSELKLDASRGIHVLADVYSGDNPLDPNDLTLNLACPYCWSNGTPLGRCQFKVRQSNRAWHLDPKGVGELIDFDGQVYRSAGTIMESQRIKCPQCTWTFRIDRNRIFEERGV